MRQIRTLMKTLPALLAAVGLLFLASDINAGGSKPKCNKPPKKSPPPKKPKCKQPKPRPTATTFSGQSSVLYFTNLAVGTVIIGDTGPLASTGGEIAVSVSETNIADVLSIASGSASTSGSGREAESEASVTGLELRIVVGGETHVLAIEQLSVRAQAKCTSHGPRICGSTTITGLSFDGTAIQVTGEANQVVEFTGGKLIINYQAGVSTAADASITVAGLVVDITDVGIGTIGAVHANIVCGTHGGPQECSDRVTGGGFIFGTPSGERANFGVGGGIQNGRLWGHLNYIDHGTGMHVKATEVTDYQVLDDITRQITYNVTIDGEAGMATVIVADKGEPGRDDLFMIQLSSGYTAGGDLGGAHPGGGNIQLHKPKCKNGKGHGDHDGDDNDDDGDNDNGHHRGDCHERGCKGGDDCKGNGGNGGDDDDKDCDGHHHVKGCNDRDCKGDNNCKGNKGGNQGNGGKGGKDCKGNKGGKSGGKGNTSGKGKKCD